jgi:hypothetical protein
MNNVRSRDPFPFSRTTEWVSPSGESLLLDRVFRDNKACVVAIWEKGIFDDNCLPEKDDTAESLDNRLKQFEIFNDIYVHVAMEEERLNASNYPQSRRITYGVGHTENFQVDDCAVDNLYHYPINNRITKYMCVPMPNYIFDFSKMVWERTRDLMPSTSRDIPPNYCSGHFYYIKFKWGINKHRDAKKMSMVLHSSCLLHRLCQ